MDKIIIEGVNIDKLLEQRLLLNDVRFSASCSNESILAVRGIKHMLDAWFDQNSCYECSSFFREIDFEMGVCPRCGVDAGEAYFNEEVE